MEWKFGDRPSQHKTEIHNNLKFNETGRQEAVDNFLDKLRT